MKDYVCRGKAVKGCQVVNLYKKDGEYSYFFDLRFIYVNAIM